jgi:hypothetical protein
MKLCALVAVLAVAAIALVVPVQAQEAAEENAGLNDPAASAQAMIDAAITARSIHVGTPVRASTKWFAGDSACHVYCPQGTVLISTLYEDPQGPGDCQPNDLMLCAPLSIR